MPSKKILLGLTVLILVSPALLPFPPSARAQEISVEFIEGILESSDAGDWIEAQIGDTLGPDARIRVGQASFVELHIADAEINESTITLSQPGIFALQELIAASKRMNSLGLSTGIAGRLHAKMIAPSEAGSTVMGVRGAGQAPEVAQLNEEELEFVNIAKDLLSESEYDDALTVFEEVLDLVTEEGEGQILYYIALTYTQMGKPIEALEALNEIEAGSDAAFASELIVLRGRLLLQSFAFAEALQCLDPSAISETDQQALQTIYNLRALSFVGLNQPDQAKEALYMALEIDAASEAGKIASEIITSLE